MMPHIIVQPQPSQAPPSQGASTSKTLKARTGSSVAQNDAASPSDPSANHPGHQKAGSNKACPQPAQFLNLFLAQMATPQQDAAALAIQNTAQIDGVYPVQLEAATDESALANGTQVLDLKSFIAMQPEVLQMLAAQSFAGESAAVQAIYAPAPGAAGAQPDTPLAGLQAMVAQPDTPLAGLPQTPKTSLANSQENALPMNLVGQQGQKLEKSNPNLSEAQSLSLATLKSGTAGSENASDEFFAVLAKSAISLADTSQTNMPLVPHKLVLAEALAARMAARHAERSAGLAIEVAPPAASTSPSEAASLGIPSLATASQAATAGIQQTPGTGIDIPAQNSPLPTSAELSTHSRLLTGQLTDGIKTAVGSDRALILNLNPPELGRVHLRIENDGGPVNAVLRVENPMTRADIEQSLPSIIRSLEQSGVQVRRIDVLPTETLPQDGSLGRQSDMQGGMPNRHDPDNGRFETRTNAAVADSSKEPDIVTSSVQASVVSDAAINIYV